MMYLSDLERPVNPCMFIQAQTRRRILIIFFLLLRSSLSWSADTSVYPRPGIAYGAKYSRNYSREYYNCQPQNWFIIQDKRGVIYSANQGAVLEYDGVSWKEIPIPGKNARSITVDSQGTIYIGGNNEIGYLDPDDSGVLRYVSLTHLLDAKYRDFGYVWRTYSTGHGIYFCTTQFLFLLDRTGIKIWQAETSFSPPFICGGKLLVRQQNRGLMEMLNGRLRLLPGGEAFALESIYAIVEFSPGTGALLIGTATKGFFLYKNNSLIPFKTEALDTVSVNQLTYGLRLADGNFAFATRKGGVFIIDNRGQLKLLFDTSLGLPDNTVWHICEDSGNNLWFALNNGISKLEYHSPFSIYDQRHGLKGMVLSAARFGSSGRLYAGTVSGLFSMNEKGIFNPVPGIPGYCRALLAYDDSLLAATEKGVFRVTETNNTPQLLSVLSNIPANVFYVTGNDRFPILAGTNRGLVSLSFNSRTRQWSSGKFLEEINEEIRTIARDPRDPQGDLWLASPGEGVIKISFPSISTPGNDNQTAPVVRRVPPSRFPPRVETHVFYAAGHVIIATGKGIFRWDEKIAGFIPDLTFGDEFAGGEKGKSVFRIVEDVNKNIWFHSYGRNMVAIPQPDRTYRISAKDFLRIPLNHVDSIYPDPLDSSVWFAGVDALIRFDTGAGSEDHPRFPTFRTFIRGVWANGTPIPGGDTYPEASLDIPSDLPFSRRSLRFSFAAPFFETEENTLYQCRLDGYDFDWTEWSGETRKDYTNLDPGLNVFRVRAKNIYGHISEEAVFRFNLLPPWYRTWWAFCIYAAAAFFMVFFIVKWRSRVLVREKQHLEQVICERTKEIKRQSEKLEEMANVKSRFFANISHEFRTPLTLIMGPLEKMLSTCGQNQQARDLKLMMRNSRRLLSLINQLLDLSKFDSGAIKLQACRQNIVPFLKGILYSFDSLAEQNDQVLTFYTAAAEITLYFDPPRLEEIMVNLLSNAVKFTPAGGKITMAVGVTNDGANKGEFLEISIRDTGPGIPKDQLTHIFDRFYQADSTFEYHHKGSGIGLSIAKEIVELHHGTISAHSSHEKGEESGEPAEPGGAEFVVRLPMGDAHLEPGEIVEKSAVSWKLPDETSEATETPETPGGRRKIPGLYMPDVGDTLEHPKVIHNAEPIIAGADTDKDIILVVEDSADMRIYIRGALEPLYTVLEAHDGEQGLHKAREIIPDLIICDVMMPLLDGYDACRALKNDIATSHIPVILLTAKAGEESILAGLETGADDYITKPFSTRILCARIKNLIDLRRQLQETFKRGLTLQPTKIKVSSIDEEFLKDLYKVLGKNISDPEFNVEELSRKLYMNRVTLYRKINALTGENPTDFIRSYRLKQGAELLGTSSKTVLEVAFDVGFSSSSYFIKCFKEEFHQLPSEYQRAEKMKAGERPDESPSPGLDKSNPYHEIP